MGKEKESPITKFLRKLRLSEREIEEMAYALSKGNAADSAVITTPCAPKNYTPPLADTARRYEWMPDACFFISQAEKSGTHDDYHAGYYYPLDISSVWETTALELIPSPQRCLDLCAAPGGKSILTQVRIKPALHIANEVHPKRLSILRHNLSRCGFHRQMYTQRLRPDQWAEMTKESFDLVLVDAPCSGQSLLAKGIANPGCFHSSTINGNAKRQRGILLSAVQTVAKGGHLLYSTCTYAPEENERNMAYIMKKHPEFQAVEVKKLQAFQVNNSDFPCYRLLPIQGHGAGGFTCLLRKDGELSELPDLPEDVLAWPVHVS